MARPRTSADELSNFFRQWLDTTFLTDFITGDQRDQYLIAFEAVLDELVSDINSAGETTLRISTKEHLRIRLREGREIRGTFNLFQVQPAGEASKRPHRKLSCFVGHRFTKEIKDALRYNFRYCLEPYGISLMWSGMDMSAVGFFDEVIRMIQSSHFCIFDNRDTENKPNVYIELGIAYAFKKPSIFLKHEGTPVEIPVDLGHIQAVPYTDYSDQTRLIFANLPAFLRENKLR